MLFSASEGGPAFKGGVILRSMPQDTVFPWQMDDFWYQLPSPRDFLAATRYYNTIAEGGDSFRDRPRTPVRSILKDSRQDKQAVARRPRAEGGLDRNLHHHPSDDSRSRSLGARWRRTWGGRPCRPGASVRASVSGSIISGIISTKCVAHPNHPRAHHPAPGRPTWRPWRLASSEGRHDGQALLPFRLLPGRCRGPGR